MPTSLPVTVWVLKRPRLRSSNGRQILSLIISSPVGSRILSVILIFRSFKLEIKVINEKVSFIKIPLLIITFFAWIYFLERVGFILTSLISFNLLILINAGQSIPLKKIVFYMLLGSIFILLLYFGFKNLLLVPLPEGLWFRA